MPNHPHGHPAMPKQFRYSPMHVQRDLSIDLPCTPTLAPLLAELSKVLLSKKLEIQLYTPRWSRTNPMPMFIEEMPLPRERGSHFR